jgi:hypothetical protein
VLFLVQQCVEMIVSWIQELVARKIDSDGWGNGTVAALST